MYIIVLHLYLNIFTSSFNILCDMNLFITRCLITTIKNTIIINNIYDVLYLYNINIYNYTLSYYIISVIFIIITIYYLSILIYFYILIIYIVLLNMNNLDLTYNNLIINYIFYMI